MSAPRGVQPARRPWRSAALLALALALVGGALAACYQPPPFVCTENLQCNLDDPALLRGACIQNSCAYVDLDCRSEYRYSRYAREPDTCVPTEFVPRDAGQDTR